MKTLGGTLMKTLGSLLAAFIFQGCYTVKQGYHQVRILARAKSIDSVLAQDSESPERQRKLKLVPEVMKFAQEQLALAPGSLYKKYVALDGNAVTWIVQAAERRSLRQKTWWFPLVGAQPYLGYFVRQDAQNFKRELDNEGWDTSISGVQAFSMLGYFPDPVYSSMLDGNDEAELAEVLIHEATHATIYVPGFSEFNENLASFFGFYGALQFLRSRSDLGFDVRSVEQKHSRNNEARKKFGEYLQLARIRLEAFYQKALVQPELSAEAAFLDARQRIFDDLASDYVSFMGSLELGSSYEGAFARGRFNNAVFLGYSLYDAKQEPFARLLRRVDGNLALFIRAIRECVSTKPETEEELWQRIELCEGENKR